ncbi:MAG: hypothetical protein Q9184_003798 [Pyrenodesmia sp. 2 TL-2023]
MYLTLILLLGHPKNEPVQYPDHYVPFNISSPKFSDSLTKNISVPLDPTFAIIIESKITYTKAPAHPPKGGQLITSLLAATVDCWLNEANQPMPLKVENDYVPFTNIRHFIESVSAPGRFLTPYKVGIIYCEIMQGLFEQGTWPGHVHADIYHVGAGPATSRSLGKMDIVAVPTSSNMDQTLQEKRDPLRQSKHNLSVRRGNHPVDHPIDQTSTMLRSEPIDEKVWLELFTRLMFWTFQHPSNMRLSERLVRGPYRFLSRIDNTTWLSLIITPYAVAPGAPFQWIDLMGGFVKLLLQTAVAEKWEALYGYDLRYFGILVAWLSIGDRSSREVGDEEGSPGVSTA